MVNKFEDEITRKLRFADLTIELGRVTRNKWAVLEQLTGIDSEEKRLLREIAKVTEELTPTDGPS